MNYCKTCGAAVKPDAKFCNRCGARLANEPVAIPAAPPAPLQSPPGVYPSPVGYSPAAVSPPLPPPPAQRFCTKCGALLESDTLFCPVCGTKNYVYQTGKTRKGELLMSFENCQQIKMILRNAGTLLIYDDRILFQAESASNNLQLAYNELAAVSPNGTLGLRLTSVGGKAYVFELSSADADSYYYVINLITDYRY
jgi:RNA polymerase subunit RPABC4/transcription elongation factor Spt4